MTFLLISHQPTLVLEKHRFAHRGVNSSLKKLAQKKYNCNGLTITISLYVLFIFHTSRLKIVEIIDPNTWEIILYFNIEIIT